MEPGISTYLDQHFNPQGEVGEGGDEVTGVCVGLGHEAEAEGGAHAVAPAAVQRLKQLRPFSAPGGLGQLFSHVPHLYPTIPGLSAVHSNLLAAGCLGKFSQGSHLRPTTQGRWVHQLVGS